MASFYDYDIFNETLEGSTEAISELETDIKTTYFVPSIETCLIQIIFVLIFIIGVVGNSTIITIFVKERNMRNISNMYIMSLTVSSLLVTVFCVPLFSINRTLNSWPSWPWGSFLCNFTPTINVLDLGVSAFTLVALSAERYLAFRNRFRKSEITRWNILSVVLIWVLGCIIALPTAIFSHVNKYKSLDGSTMSICTRLFDDEIRFLHYEPVLKILLLYIIPYLIIKCLYLLMAGNLHTVQYTPSQNLQGEFHNEVRTKRQLDWLMVSFALVFFVCFLPFYLLEISIYFFPKLWYYFAEYLHVLGAVAFCFRFFYSCVNPIVLYFVSDTYKQHIRKYLLCKCR